MSKWQDKQNKIHKHHEKETKDLPLYIQKMNKSWTQNQYKKD